MRFEPVRRLTVRREFKLRPDGALEAHRDCGIGCTCEATIWKATPNAALAESKTLCFHDRAQQGISELSGTARLIRDADGVKVYELAADLVEARR